MGRRNIYEPGAYGDGQAVPYVPGLYDRTFNTPNRPARIQTGAIRALSYIIGATQAGFNTPGVFLDFTLNNIQAGGVSVFVFARDGRQLMITELLGDGVNLHPNVGRFVVLRFWIDGVPVSDWLQIVSERQVALNAVPTAAATNGYYPGVTPVTFDIDFDSLEFALIGGASNVNIQGYVATGDARFSGSATPIA